MFFTRKPSLIVHSTFSTLRPSEVMVIPSPHPNPNTLTHIDITKLTQSELYTLSLLSTLPSPSPTLSPTLNPSIFNSSLATRRQTFSRPSSSTKPHQSTTRLPKKLPPLLQTPTQNDPDYNHNKIIISLLKNLIKNENPDGIIVNSFIVEGNFDQLFSKNSNFTGEKKRKKKIHNTPDGNFVNSLTPTSHFNELSPKNDVKKRKKKVYNDGKLVNSELLEGEFVKKRKKVRESSSEVVIEIVNKNGVVVDIDQLSNKVDPFGEELRKRTNGMVSEEECLVFLRDLGGQWGSRRKKRKIVSACDFGGTFPVGWKLILGLRRKEGRVSVYIRRYISPTGQQFVSCKEVASFLRSYFGDNNLDQPTSLRVHNILPPYRETSGSHAGVTYQDDGMGNNLISNTRLLTSSSSNEQDKEVALLGIENLADVQVRDLFECHRCNLSFDEKEIYLQHLMTSHQKTTRRYRLGSSVGDGVIVKDGKYECQFCHKIFEERRKYNSHVGIHVRGNARKSELIPAQVTVGKKIESPSGDASQTGFSKMDALIEIAQNSMLEASNKVIGGERNDNSAHNGLNVAFTQETYAVNKIDHELETESHTSEPEMEDNIGGNQYEELNLKDDEGLLTDEDIQSDYATSNVDVNKNSSGSGTIGPIDGLVFSNDSNDEYGIEQCGGFGCGHADAPHNEPNVYDVKTNLSTACTKIMEHPELEEVGIYKNSELEIGLESSNIGLSVEFPDGTIKQNSVETVIQSGTPCSPMTTEQPLHCFPTFNSVSRKGDNKLRIAEQKLENVSGFEELKLDDLESLRFNFLTEEESPSFPELPMDMAASGPEVEGEFDASVGFGSGTEEVMVSMAGRCEVTSVCVWCTMEFTHVAVDSEIHSDSVGYMCPTCKAKISGQLNVFNNDLSMNPHHF